MQGWRRSRLGTRETVIPGFNVSYELVGLLSAACLDVHYVCPTVAGAALLSPMLTLLVFRSAAAVIEPRFRCTAFIDEHGV